MTYAPLSPVSSTPTPNLTIIAITCLSAANIPCTNRRPAARASKGGSSKNFLRQNKNVASKERAPSSKSGGASKTANCKGKPQRPRQSEQLISNLLDQPSPAQAELAGAAEYDLDGGPSRSKPVRRGTHVISNKERSTAPPERDGVDNMNVLLDFGDAALSGVPSQEKILMQQLQLQRQQFLQQQELLEKMQGQQRMILAMQGASGSNIMGDGDGMSDRYINSENFAPAVSPSPNGRRGVSFSSDLDGLQATAWQQRGAYGGAATGSRTITHNRGGLSGSEPSPFLPHIDPVPQAEENTFPRGKMSRKCLLAGFQHTAASLSYPGEFAARL